ncbi:MAG: hypothetical protein QOK17_631, partial [Sphingomonadales bacterium]|nr:hypothetical protein [Sphingomonadales bacterium]
DVSNIGLLQRQMIWLQIGLASFVSGVILIAAGVLADHLAGVGHEPHPEVRPSTPSDADPATEVIPAAESPPDENPDTTLYWLAGIALFVLIVIVIAITLQLDNKPTTAADTSSSNYATDDALMGNDVTAVDATNTSIEPPPRPSPRPRVLQQAPLDNDTDANSDEISGNDIDGE